MVRCADKEKAAAIFGCEMDINEAAFISPVITGEQLANYKEEAAKQGIELLSTIRVLDY